MKLRMFPDFLAWRSLKTRVTVVVLTIFLLGIWSLAFYASRMLREDMQRLLGAQQVSTVSLLAAQVNENLAERLSALETVAASITPALMANTAALQALLERRPVFQSFFNGGTLAFRSDGTAIAEYPLAAGRIGVNYMDRDYLAAALKEGKATISRPVIGRMLKAPIFAMTVPIRDVQGKVIGALSGAIDLSKPNFLNTIMEQRYGKSGGYLLVAPQHRLVVTASDKRRIMEALPAPGISPMIDRFVQGYEGSAVLVNPVGEEVLASAKSVPVAGWYTVVHIPATEAFAPIYDLQRRMLLATILLTLLAGGLTWWMLRRQLAPMLAAVKSLAILSDTHRPPQPLPIARQDEIGDLIGGFNRLLEALAQREEALRESESRFRAFFDHVAVGVAIRPARDRAAPWTHVNDQFCKLMGYTREELLQLNTAAITPPDEKAAAVADNERLLRGEISSYFREKQVLGKGGRKVWVHLSVAALPDAEGHPANLIAVYQDITERKRVEKALREQEFDSLANHLPDLVARFDHDHRYTFINATVEAIIGLPREHFIGKTMREAGLPEELARAYDDSLAKVFATGKEHEFEIVSDTLRGRRLFDVRHVPETGPGGEVATVLCVTRDITEQKRAQDELRRQKHLLEAVIDNIPARVFIRDAKTSRYVMRNRFSDEGSGHPIGSSIGKSVYDLYPREFADLFSSTDAEALKTGRLVEIPELRVTGKSGEPRIRHVRKMPVFDENGQPWMLVGISIDITERKHAEQERLTHAIHQRDALVKEVHHRIKNSLQGVAGLLRQKISKYPAIAPSIEEAIAQLQSVALVYGLQETRSDGLLSLAEIMNAICSSAESLLGGRVERAFERKSQRPACLAGSEAVSVAVALNELIFNALKHQPAKEGEKHAHIVLRETADEAEIRITNPGRLPEGFDYAGGGVVGHGLGLVRTLLASPGGIVTFNGAQGEVEVVLKLGPPLLAGRQKAVAG